MRPERRCYCHPLLLLVPAFMLMADRAIELRVATRSSPCPPANDQMEAPADDAAITVAGVNEPQNTAPANFLHGMGLA